ncbi:hypothetical protein [Paenibacillus sp. TH7-28]
MEQETFSLQNSGALCSYYPELSMFIPNSGIFRLYLPTNGPEYGHFLATGENSAMNFPYFSQMDGHRRNNDVFFPYHFRWNQRPPDI